MTKTYLTLFFAGITCIPGVCRSKGFTEELIDKADAIVVGELQRGQQNGYDYKFTLAVVRSIKGSLNTGQIVTVSGSQGRDFYRGKPSPPITYHYYGIWFLKQDGASSNFQLLPVKSKHLDLQDSGFYETSRNASPGLIHTSTGPVTLADQVALELGGALLTYNGNVNQLFLLSHGLFQIQNSSLSPEIYNTLHNSSDPELKIVGLAGLLSTDAYHLSALNEIAAGVGVLGKARASRYLASISNERNPDPRVIAVLGKIALSATDFTQSAAEALQYIHTKETVPYLGALLDSQDAQTREYAIRGLSRFVDNLPVTGANAVDGGWAVPLGPAPYKTAETDKYSLSGGTLYQRDEGPYLQFWKRWYATVGKLIN